MIEKFQEEQRRKLSRAQSIRDFVVGVMLLLVGIFFMVYKYFGIRLLDREPAPIDLAIGVLFIIYGAWRIYRGYKKDYYQ